jgi:hypothetical protein
MTPRPSNYPLINRVGNYYWLTTPPEAPTQHKTKFSMKRLVPGCVL